jgi:hypothetical protein
MVTFIEDLRWPLVCAYIGSMPTFTELHKRCQSGTADGPSVAVDLRHLQGLLRGVGGCNGPVAPPPPPLPTAGGSRTAEPTPTLPATAVGRAPSGDTRLTASRDATAIESSTANEPAKIHH